jgi:hypothetical protein
MQHAWNAGADLAAHITLRAHAAAVFQVLWHLFHLDSFLFSIIR